MSELQKLLWFMAAYPEYEMMLDTPGLANYFNSFVKMALEMEEELERLKISRH